MDLFPVAPENKRGRINSPLVPDEEYNKHIATHFSLIVWKFL